MTGKRKIGSCLFFEMRKKVREVRGGLDASTAAKQFLFLSEVTLTLGHLKLRLSKFWTCN